MDLIRLLRSLEEFLYELIGWFVFYPRTFWRIVFHPGAMAHYTRAELEKDVDSQFQDTISPVLMLILSVAIAHVIELAVNVPMPTTASPVRQFLFGSEQGILLTRSTVFCVFALGAALGTLRRKRLPVTRVSLREPFSIQAFVVSPFVVLLSVGALIARTNTGSLHWGGVVVASASIVWYLLARTAAYRALYGGGWARPFVSVCVWFLLTCVAVLTLLALLAR
jgi:hypothetical protein